MFSGAVANLVHVQPTEVDHDLNYSSSLVFGYLVGFGVGGFPAIMLAMIERGKEKGEHVPDNVYWNLFFWFVLPCWWLLGAFLPGLITSSMILDYNLNQTSDPACKNTCEFAKDGLCCDGGGGVFGNHSSTYESGCSEKKCPFGHDCSDCGPRHPFQQVDPGGVNAYFASLSLPLIVFTAPFWITFFIYAASFLFVIVRFCCIKPFQMMCVTDEEERARAMKEGRRRSRAMEFGTFALSLYNFITDILFVVSFVTLRNSVEDDEERDFYNSMFITSLVIVLLGCLGNIFASYRFFAMLRDTHRDEMVSVFEGSWLTLPVIFAMLVSPEALIFLLNEETPAEAAIVAREATWISALLSDAPQAAIQVLNGVQGRQSVVSVMTAIGTFLDIALRASRSVVLAILRSRVKISHENAKDFVKVIFRPRTPSGRAAQRVQIFTFGTPAPIHENHPNYYYTLLLHVILAIFQAACLYLGIVLTFPLRDDAPLSLPPGATQPRKESLAAGIVILLSCFVGCGIRGYYSVYYLRTMRLRARQATAAISNDLLSGVLFFSSILLHSDLVAYIFPAESREEANATSLALNIFPCPWLFFLSYLPISIALATEFASTHYTNGIESAWLSVPSWISFVMALVFFLLTLRTAALWVLRSPDDMTNELFGVDEQVKIQAKKETATVIDTHDSEPKSDEKALGDDVSTKHVPAAV